MISLARLLALACACVLLAAPLSWAADGSEAPAAGASAKPKGKAKGKGQPKRKACKKGYVRKTVTRKGKRVSVCRKKQTKPKPAPGSGGPSQPTGIFEAPGKVLEGPAAVPFLQRYLNNSTFTSCPAGWPNCGPIEERYSHHADGSFYYCRLTNVSGSDILYSDSYGVDAARVEADGTWTFRETVSNGGNNSVYEWRVATDGTVTGAYRFSSFAEIQQLGPFKYVPGARNCSY